MPLIPTLLRIAAEYDLPMGSERGVKEGLERPVRVKLRRGTGADLLDLCIRPRIREQHYHAQPTYSQELDECTGQASVLE